MIFLFLLACWTRENRMPHMPRARFFLHMYIWSCLALSQIFGSSRSALSYWQRLSRVPGKDLSYHLLCETERWRCTGLNLEPSACWIDALPSSQDWIPFRIGFFWSHKLSVTLASILVGLAYCLIQLVNVFFIYLLTYFILFTFYLSQWSLSDHMV